MKILRPDHYDKFLCKASDCEDTCCVCWQVELDSGFLNNSQRSFDNKNEIRQKLDSVTKGFGTSKHFKNNRNGACPFLTEKRLCELQSEFGHSVLPRTCRLYPRFINNFGGYEERGLSFSCPEAARMIYCGNYSYKMTEEDIPICYTDVDADLFYAVKAARDKLLSFADSEEFTVNVLSRIIEFAGKVQTGIDLCDYVSVDQLELTEKSGEFCFPDAKKIIKFHRKNTILRKNFKKELSVAMQSPVNVNCEELKIWLKYFLFRYLLVSGTKRDFLSCVKAAIVSYVAICALGGGVNNMQKYSKETEHNERNMKRLFYYAGKFKFNDNY